MKFTNSFSRDLGVFTWAELQSAYANGGGALAALPAGVTAFVSNWNARFTPNTAKTAWVPVGVCVMGQLSASVAHTGTVAETTVYSCSIPASLMTAISNLRWRPGLVAAANAGSASIKYKFDSTQIDSNGLGANTRSSSIAELRNYGGTSTNAYQYNVAYTAASTLATANAWTFNLTVTLNNSADTVTLYAMALELY